MADRKYFVLCSNNCKFESMTKEQILAAIAQATATGEIGDVDTGFVTKIKEMNSGAPLSFWVGTQAQYNALETIAENCFYIISDANDGADLDAILTELIDKTENAPVLHKTLWTGDVQVGEGDYRNIHVPDISKYKVISIDGDVYHYCAGDDASKVQNPRFECTKTLQYYDGNIEENAITLVVEKITKFVMLDGDTIVLFCKYNDGNGITLDSYYGVRFACTQDGVKSQTMNISNVSIKNIVGIC